jgi:hypothetical protein
MKLLSIYISVNRWTIKEKETKRKGVNHQGEYWDDAFFQGNDFSLGGDADNCGK